IYSYARGVSSARQISREMEHEPGLQWLAGMEVVNHHTLSDFRVAHGSALQNLMEQVLGVLFSEGLVGLERVTQDGTKIRAQASKRSFLDRKHLQQSLDLAKRHMANVDADNVDPLSQHQGAARYRVQRERETKLQSALQSLSTFEQAKKHSEPNRPTFPYPMLTLALCVMGTGRLRRATTSNSQLTQHRDWWWG